MEVCVDGDGISHSLRGFLITHGFETTDVKFDVRGVAGLNGYFQPFRRHAPQTEYTPL